MHRQLTNKRILITGASSGIGRCVGRRFIEAGARMILTARSESRLNETFAGLGEQILVARADITCDDDRQYLIGMAEKRWGGLDLLINNAGIASWGHFVESTEEVLRQIMETNFFAPVELTRLAIPLLQNGVEPAVVNVASMCGRRAMPAWPEYSASKYAICGMTEALRGELSRFDIDVLLMLPGLTRTGLHANMLRSAGKAQIDFDSGMPPEKVADRIVKAICKNRTETAIGGDSRWMLLVNRFFPRMVDRLLARKVRALYADPPQQTANAKDQHVAA